MPRGFKMLLATLVAAGVTAGVALAGYGSGQFSLLGPTGNAWCNGSGVISGAAANYGYVVITAGPIAMSKQEIVKTNVVIIGQQPNTSYAVRVIQGIGDCWTPDGTVSTNAQGNGTGQFTEPGVSSTAFVAIDPPSGPWFVTATLHH